MKYCLLAVLGLSLTLAAPLDRWQQFKTKYGKIYRSNEEELMRLRIFLENDELIAVHNAKPSVTFTLAHNHLSDLTMDEIRSQFKGYVMSKERGVNAVDSWTSVQLNAAPPTKNWTAEGAVTPVKNQERCGSCWSFSTTGGIEGAWYLKHHQLVSLSEQQLIDCSTGFGNMACQGGWTDAAYQYVEQNHGIDTEKSYAYKMDGPNQCDYRMQDRAATITGHRDVQQGSEDALKVAVAQQPVSVAIDANHHSFHFYESGVYFEPECSNTQLDHAVLAVGYGTLNGKDYWLVKNSWGTKWGADGYIMMSRNQNNNCGIATQASYPVV